MSSKNNFAAASLRLFNSVLESPDNASLEPKVLMDYSTVIAPSALHYEGEIVKYLKKEKVSGRQMNQTFYSTPEEVEGKSFSERVADQLMHYFSTYGLRSLGIDTDFMYVPNDWERTQIPEPLKFSVITGVTADVLVSASLRLLESGVAMKQETIEDVLVILDGCEYKFNGSEQIRNKEARVFIYDRKNILPTNGEDLFRYMVYKATGSTLLVKDTRTLDQIRVSSYKIPTLSDSQMEGLAQSFNRRKEYWMAFKASSDSNRSLVNRLTRLSKRFHRPMSESPLSLLTSGKMVSPTELEKALKSANIYQVIRAANAVKMYSTKSENRLYVIRNGRSFVKPAKDPINRSSILAILEDHIRLSIDKTKKVYIPPAVQYALPTSEKMFTGNVPNFSVVEADMADRDLLVGIYWENGSYGHVDYDLSFNSITGQRVGWNSRWSDGELVFSGDITNATKGAAEWAIVKNLKSSWQIYNNLYSGCYAQGSTIPEFTIMVGYGKKEKAGANDYRNYFIKPDDLLFSAKVTPTKRQTTLGVLSPTKDGKARFMLLNSNDGNRHVAVPGKGSVSMISAVLSRVEDSLKLNDYVNLCSDPSEADVDLSPRSLSKDSILTLLG